MLLRGRSALPAAAGLVGLLVLSACGGGDDAGGSTSERAGASAGLNVVASFYPLQYVTGRIAGDRAEVSSLTAPGAEPHDLELTAKAVGEVSDADLLVYLHGFQPAVDEAVEGEGADRAVDVAPAADLDLTASEEEHAEEEGGAAGEEHAEEMTQDPHFWLDPVRLSAVSAAIADRLSKADPDGAATYTANLRSLQGDLTALDGELEQGLSACASKDLVTSHQAFGYLAQRYGLRQVGVSGLSPESEPDPAKLAEVTDFVRTNKVRTIYYETLVSPAVAQTVASETGAATAVLDPIEGLTDASAGQDYLAVMRSNLAALQKGQPCT